MSESFTEHSRAQPAQDPSALGPRTSALSSGPSALSIGGLTPLTTIDYPGELAAVVFCQGCPWRCRYCQNPHLVPRRGRPVILWDGLLAWLQRRRGLLDAVVFSGGEPTLQRNLPRAMEEVRALGFKVGLHTAGCYPERLRRLLPLTDWVGLDIKASPEAYPSLTRVPGSGVSPWRSLRYLLAANRDHEVRVTVHSELIPPAELERLLGLLKKAGVRTATLQRCRSVSNLDEGLTPNRAAWPPADRYPVELG